MQTLSLLLVGWLVERWFLGMHKYDTFWWSYMFCSSIFLMLLIKILTWVIYFKCRCARYFSHAQWAMHYRVSRPCFTGFVACCCCCLAHLCTKGSGWAFVTGLCSSAAVCCLPKSFKLCPFYWPHPKGHKFILNNKGKSLNKIS